MIQIKFNSFSASITGLSEDVSESFRYLFSIYLEEEDPEKLSKADLPLSHLGGNNYSLSKEENGALIIPTGLLKQITDELKKLGHAFSVEKDITVTLPIDKPLDTRLRPEQIIAVPRFLQWKRALISMATGLGKTTLAAETFSYFPQAQRLILVPTANLLFQMQEDLARYYGIDPSEIGLIGQGKFIIKPITVAIPDTLSSKIQKNDLTTIDYLSTVEVVVYDELHNHANFTSILVSKYLSNACYKLGLTATHRIPKYLILEALTGPLVYEVGAKEAIEGGNIMEPVIEFHEAPGTNIPHYLLTTDFSNFSSPLVKKRLHKLYEAAIITNRGRNELAAKITYDAIQTNSGPILVLVKAVGTTVKKKGDIEISSISHADIFQEILEELYGIRLPIIHGKTSKKEKEKVFEELSNGTLSGAIASVGILSEGVSIPALQYINNLAAGSKEKDFLQRIGRALRTQAGKGQPKYFDYMDTAHSVYANQSRKRKKAAEENYPVGSVIVVPH